MTDAPPPLPDLPVRRALAAPLRARLLGSGIVVVAVLVLLAALLVWLLPVPGVVLSVVVAVCGVGLVVLLALLLPRHWVLRMDADGYRVRVLRSAQARTARWTDVRDLQTTTIAGNRCLVLRLRDGRTTTLPVGVLDGDPEEVVALVTAQLDRANGYKRIR